MHQNTFLPTPDVKKYFFKDLIPLPGNASKHVFNHSDVEKYLFYGLDSGGLEMHQNTFQTTPDVEKHLL